jgi:lysophospholipid acyltransferase (LPLAT)-like uncharacterized protein
LLKQKFAGLLAGFLYKIYSSTFRYEVVFEKEEDRQLFYKDLHTLSPSPGENLIYASFHQDDLTCLSYFSVKNFVILISQSKDGQILASTSEFLGYQTVRGSSHRGGVAGLLAAMKKVIAGHKIIFAVDGPKGPIYKVKEGIIALSQKTKRPIVPLKGNPDKKIVFKKSWNQATLPLPFSKIKIVIGEIKYYSAQELEDTLLRLASY